MRPSCEPARSPHISISAAERIRTFTVLASRTSDSSSWSTATCTCRWECWDSHPVVSRQPLYRRLRCLNRQHSRRGIWGDRRDLHPFKRGSRPRASTTSVIDHHAVHEEGIEPSPFAYRAIARPSCYSWKRSPRQMAGSDPAVVTPHGGPNLRRQRRQENRAKHAASESNAAAPDLESTAIPDGDACQYQWKDLHPLQRTSQTRVPSPGHWHV